MKKLHAAIDRFTMLHPGFGIPNLMRGIVIGQVIVYLLTLFTRPGAAVTMYTLLAFDGGKILHGQIWRLVTFIFLPYGGFFLGIIGQLIYFYFTWYIGAVVEQQWGTSRFSLYYLCGVILTILSGCISLLASGGQYDGITTFYLNLTLFLAYAALNPDDQIYLMMILPLKAKWIAWADAALLAWGILQSLVALDLAGVLMPIVAVFNFVIFFWPEISGWVSWNGGMVRRRTSPRTIQFRAAARKIRRQEEKQGYRHKCEVCGRTDADHPELEFRYCSRCAGYHCFCVDHIFNHEHFRA